MSVQVSYKKQTIFGFLLILIMLISVEGVLRAYDFQYPNCRLTNSDVFSNFDEDLKRSICLDNDNLIWNHHPNLNLEPNQHYATIDINMDGFRGNEIELKKAFDTYRIFVIGGSTTFGVGSSSNETSIPGYLQEYFSTMTELNVEVINAGIPSAFSNTEFNYIQNKILDYDPDLLIIYDGLNDSTISTDEYLMSSEEPSLISQIMKSLIKSKNYETPGILLKNWNNFRFDTTDISKIPIYNDMASEDWYHAFQDKEFLTVALDQRVNLWKQTWTKVCEQGKRDGFEVIVTLQPILGTGNKQLTVEEQNNYVKYNQDIILPNYLKFIPAVNELKSICSNSMDLTNSFDNNLETIFFDHGHVGDRGNKIMAKELFDLSLPVVMKKSIE